MNTMDFQPDNEPLEGGNSRFQGRIHAEQMSRAEALQSLIAMLQQQEGDIEARIDQVLGVLRAAELPAPSPAQDAIEFEMAMDEAEAEFALILNLIEAEELALEEECARLEEEGMEAHVAVIRERQTQLRREREQLQSQFFERQMQLGQAVQQALFNQIVSLQQQISRESANPSREAPQRVAEMQRELSQTQERLMGMQRKMENTLQEQQSRQRATAQQRDVDALAARSREAQQLDPSQRQQGQRASEQVAHLAVQRQAATLSLQSRMNDLLQTRRSRVQEQLQAVQERLAQAQKQAERAQTERGGQEAARAAERVSRLQTLQARLSQNMATVEMQMQRMQLMRQAQERTAQQQQRQGQEQSQQALRQLAAERAAQQQSQQQASRQAANQVANNVIQMRDYLARQSASRSSAEHAAQLRVAQLASYIRDANHALPPIARQQAGAQLGQPELTLVKGQARSETLTPQDVQALTAQLQQQGKLPVQGVSQEALASVKTLKEMAQALGLADEKELALAMKEMQARQAQQQPAIQQPQFRMPEPRQEPVELKAVPQKPSFEVASGGCHPCKGGCPNCGSKLSHAQHAVSGWTALQENSAGLNASARQPTPEDRRETERLLREWKDATTPEMLAKINHYVEAQAPQTRRYLDDRDRQQGRQREDLEKLATQHDGLVVTIPSTVPNLKNMQPASVDTSLGRAG